MGRQGQQLLIQIEIRDDDEGPLSSEERYALQKALDGTLEEQYESDTDRLISQRLVVFKNVVYLQKKNQELLKITRQLGREMENNESQSTKN